MKFDKLVKDYQKSPGYRKLSPNSARLYDYFLDILVDHFRDRDILSLKRSDMIRLINLKADKPASANLMLRVASVLFSFAVDLDEIPYNPAARLKRLKIGSHVKWDAEEAKKVVAIGDRVVSTAVALAWYTGQREGDILNMKWEDVREGFIHIKQGKTGHVLLLKVHPDLADWLLKIRGDSPGTHYIVSGDKRLSGQAFRGRFRRVLEGIEMQKTFHGIRKGVASMLAENGRSTTEIAAILGHKTTRMAEYYAEQASDKKLASNAVDNLTGCI